MPWARERDREQPRLEELFRRLSQDRRGHGCESGDHLERKIPLAGAPNAAVAQLVHRGIARGAHELDVLERPEKRDSTRVAPYREGALFFPMLRDGRFERVAILDELHRPLDPAEILRQREQRWVRLRVAFTVAKGMYRAGTVGRGFPANVIARLSDGYFDFLIAQVFTLAHSLAPKGSIDQCNSGAVRPLWLSISFTHRLGGAQ